MLHKSKKAQIMKSSAKYIESESSGSSESDSMKEYRAECDLRTCLEAMEIKSDPKRWKEVQRKAKEQASDLDELSKSSSKSKTSYEEYKEKNVK